ncbi:hypothetical protein ACWKWP_09175 [Agromyces soli]
MNDVVIDPEVMTRDAEEVWQTASDRVRAMATAPHALAVGDFGFAFDMFTLHSAYTANLESLSSYLEGASAEFLRFEERLLQAVIIYGESHGLSQQEIAALEKEIDR